jgi:hypothetical protein
MGSWGSPGFLDFCASHNLAGDNLLTNCDLGSVRVESRPKVARNLLENTIAPEFQVC